MDPIFILLDLRHLLNGGPHGGGLVAMARLSSFRLGRRRPAKSSRRSAGNETQLGLDFSGIEALIKASHLEAQRPPERHRQYSDPARPS